MRRNIIYSSINNNNEWCGDGIEINTLKRLQEILASMILLIDTSTNENMCRICVLKSVTNGNTWKETEQWEIYVFLLLLGNAKENSQREYFFRFGS